MNAALAYFALWIGGCALVAAYAIWDHHRQHRRPQPRIGTDAISTEAARGIAQLEALLREEADR